MQRGDKVTVAIRGSKDMGMKLLIGMSAKSGKFGVIPDAPEPDETECTNEYVEGSCECCDHFEQCQIAWKEDEE